MQYKIGSVCLSVGWSCRYVHTYIQGVLNRAAVKHTQIFQMANMRCAKEDHDTIFNARTNGIKLLQAVKVTQGFWIFVSVR